jgi:ParB family chromosome partitioning protein
MATASIDLSEELFDLDALGVERAAPTGTPLKLDAGCIRPSRWANRHEASFDSPEFQELKAEIQDASGNVQPIKVRPLPKPDGEVRYEVVFGHRRHRACLELGLQVSVVVEEMDDRRLWTDMERENRARANLSPWELGRSYKRALDAGLFPSMRALGEAIGRNSSGVTYAVTIANLPDEVVSAFASPADIQFRYAKDLRDAVAKAPAEVCAVARSLAGKRASANEVFLALTAAAMPAEAEPAGVLDGQARSSNGLPEAPAMQPAATVLDGQAPDVTPFQSKAAKVSTPPVRRLQISGKPVVIQSDGADTVVRINAGLLPQERWTEFEKAIRKLLA